MALRGVSLRISAGCFFGLLGPNGSGKSTLIGMATGLVRAPRGQPFAFGHDVVADYQRARLEVGLAAQDIHLDRFLTTQEVLTYHGRYFGMSPGTPTPARASWCEQVAFIHRGEITAEGTVEDLIARFGGARLEDAYLEAMR